MGRFAYFWDMMESVREISSTLFISIRYRVPQIALIRYNFRHRTNRNDNATVCLGKLRHTVIVSAASKFCPKYPWSAAWEAHIECRELNEAKYLFFFSLSWLLIDSCHLAGLSSLSLYPRALAQDVGPNTFPWDGPVVYNDHRPCCLFPKEKPLLLSAPASLFHLPCHCRVVWDSPVHSGPNHHNAHTDPWITHSRLPRRGSSPRTRRHRAVHSVARTVSCRRLHNANHLVVHVSVRGQPVEVLCHPFPAEASALS